jgi:hypothetical protein
MYKLFDFLYLTCNEARANRLVYLKKKKKSGKDWFGGEEHDTVGVLLNL